VGRQGIQALARVAGPAKNRSELVLPITSKAKNLCGHVTTEIMIRETMPRQESGDTNYGTVSPPASDTGNIG